MMRRLPPYAAAIGGALAITAAIGVVSAYYASPGLSALYLLLVLWLGATWGRGPAVAGSVAAFVLFDYFFVPPVGTLTVSGPRELLELLVLLAAALVTGQLAASLRRTQAAAEAIAAESRALYELATAALRSPEVTVALDLLCERAVRLNGVSRFALVGMDFGQTVPLAGGEPTSDELRQAAWSYDNSRPVGIEVSDGTVRLMRSRPPVTTAYLPLASGVALIGVDPERGDADGLRTLAALIGLADLLLDRRRAGLEAERARGLEVSDRLKAAILSSL
jgi:two-component system sensor histidine kinase KdpD